jgi:hypothetical protein
MARLLTPAWGPHRGVPCWREPDGSERPVTEGSALGLPTPSIGQADPLGHARETVAIMVGQMVEQGQDPDYARHVAITAARRNLDGETDRPYRPRS